LQPNFNSRLQIFGFEDCKCFGKVKNPMKRTQIRADLRFSRIFWLVFIIASFICTLMLLHSLFEKIDRNPIIIYRADEAMSIGEVRNERSKEHLRELNSFRFLSRHAQSATHCRLMLKTSTMLLSETEISVTGKTITREMIQKQLNLQQTF
jgi:hypothetical protein